MLEDGRVTGQRCARNSLNRNVIKGGEAGERGGDGWVGGSGRGQVQTTVLEQQ